MHRATLAGTRQGACASISPTLHDHAQAMAHHPVAMGVLVREGTAFMQQPGPRASSPSCYVRTNPRPIRRASRVPPTRGMSRSIQYVPYIHRTTVQVERFLFSQKKRKSRSPTLYTRSALPCPASCALAAGGRQPPTGPPRGSRPGDWLGLGYKLHSKCVLQVSARRLLHMHGLAPALSLLGFLHSYVWKCLHVSSAAKAPTKGDGWCYLTASSPPSIDWADRAARTYPYLPS
jgi:hypothetical protein